MHSRGPEQTAVSRGAHRMEPPARPRVLQGAYNHMLCCLQQNALVMPPQVPGDAAPPSPHRLTPKKNDQRGRQLTLYDHICKTSFLIGSRVTFHCGESNTYVSLELLCSVF